MPETTALGAAMAAGSAVGLWDLEDGNTAPITTDTFNPLVTGEGYYNSLIFINRVFESFRCSNAKRS